jgi:hypothetical protein
LNPILEMVQCLTALLILLGVFVKLWYKATPPPPRHPQPGRLKCPACGIALRLRYRGDAHGEGGA